MIRKLGLHWVILLGIVGFCKPIRALGDSIVNAVESASKLTSVPDGNYLVRLEIAGQMERLKFSVQSNQVRCTDSSDSKLISLRGTFESGTNGVFLLSLQGREYSGTQVWIFRGDGTASIREVPDRGEQQSASPLLGDAADRLSEEKQMRGEEMAKAREGTRFASEAETRRSVYEPFLKGLGLSEDKIATVLSRLDLLLRGAVAAGEPMQELMIARADYIREMRKLMGEPVFARYEAFERSKPYRREAGLIQGFAATRQATVAPQFQDRLVALLQEFALHTTESWDGPYDPAPRPLAGTEPVVAGIDAYTSRIRAGLPGFQAKVAAEFPADLTKLAGDYFTQKLAEFDESRRMALMTLEERRELRTRRFQEERRQRIGEAKKTIPPL